MLNVLIMEKNINFCKEIANNLSISKSNIRMCGIVNSKDELKDFKKTKVDIIIIGDGFEKGLNHILEENLDASIIFLNSFREGKNTYGIKNDCNIQKFLIDSIDKIVDEIILLKDKEMLIKENIKEELKKLFFDFSLLGTKYLVETIYNLYIVKDKYIDNLERDIYPIVAKKFRTSVRNVKSDIRNAIDMMCVNNEIKKLNQYFNYDFEDKALKPKSVIISILNKI